VTSHPTPKRPPFRDWPLLTQHGGKSVFESSGRAVFLSTLFQPSASPFLAILSGTSEHHARRPPLPVCRPPFISLTLRSIFPRPSADVFPFSPGHPPQPHPPPRLEFLPLSYGRRLYPLKQPIVLFLSQIVPPLSPLIYSFYLEDLRIRPFFTYPILSQGVAPPLFGTLFPIEIFLNRLTSLFLRCFLPFERCLLLFTCLLRKTGVYVSRNDPEDIFLSPLHAHLIFRPRLFDYPLSRKTRKEPSPAFRPLLFCPFFFLFCDFSLPTSRINL